MSFKNPIWFVPRGLMAGVLTLLTCCAASARADVFSNVPEATSGGYQLLYTLPVANAASYGSTLAPYSVDNSAKLTGSISRVAYYMELKTSTGTLQYAYASVAAFSQNVKLLGLPTAVSGAYFNQGVYDMHVYSNVSGITTGTGMTGNLEFFCGNYSADSAINVANCSGSIYDWGDDPKGPHGGGGYGSFQIANPLKSQEIICYNNWGGNGGNGDIGLGTNTAAGGNPDWSFTNGAANYTVKNIQVLVQLGAPPARTQIMPLGDSITAGYESVTPPEGYRTPLYTSLAGTGRSYDYIGSLGSGTGTLLSLNLEGQNEGHSGYKISDLTANINANSQISGTNGGYWLGGNPGVQPKYILLHIGANDINGGYDPTTTNPSDSQFVLDMIGRLQSLVSAILAQRPNTHILLAGIVPVNTTPNHLTRTILYNQDIRSMVMTSSAYAGKLTYVDQYSGFLNADGSINGTLIYGGATGLHPDDAGYQVMANTWFATINALDTALPGISGIAATSGSSTSTVVSGVVNPSGQAATFYVNYGLDTTYGHTTATQQIASSMFSNVPISAQISGLSAGATYHYQVVATTSAGTSTSADGVFAAGSNAPIITSAVSTTGSAAQPFNYQIVATNSPTTYAASGLLQGLSINTSIGLISGTPTTDGINNVTVSATNASGTGTIPLTITVNATFAGWQTLNFTAADLSNPAVSGLSATPAGDGIPNLLKYALNLVPKASGNSGLPTQAKITIGSASYLVLAYSQLRYATDVTYACQVSNDLQTWNSGTPYTTLVSATNNADGVTETVTTRELTPINASSQQFMRLMVTKP